MVKSLISLSCLMCIWEVKISQITLKNLIIESENPFGSTFDATRVWGPIIGTNVSWYPIRIRKKEK